MLLFFVYFGISWKNGEVKSKDFEFFWVTQMNRMFLHHSSVTGLQSHLPSTNINLQRLHKEHRVCWQRCQSRFSLHDTMMTVSKFKFQVWKPIFRHFKPTDFTIYGRLTFCRYLSLEATILSIEKLREAAVHCPWLEVGRLTRCTFTKLTSSSSSFKSSLLQK